MLRLIENLSNLAKLSSELAYESFISLNNSLTTSKT